MFTADRFAVVLSAFQNALFQNTAASRGHIGRRKLGLDAPPHRFDQQVKHRFWLHSILCQTMIGGAAAFQQQTEEKMFTSDIGMSQQTCLRERKVDCIIGARGKSAESKHKVTIL